MTSKRIRTLALALAFVALGLAFGTGVASAQGDNCYRIWETTCFSDTTCHPLTSPNICVYNPGTTECDCIPIALTK